MTRIILKLFPRNIRHSVFWRLFSKDASKRKNLFSNAPLSFANHIKMDLSPVDTCHQLIAYTGFFELHLTKLVQKIASTGGTFIDVGANYGYYSLMWAANSENHRTIAFEAYPPNFDKLKANIFKNGLDSRVQSLNRALGRKNENMFFDLKDENQTTWGGLTHNQNLGTKIETKKFNDFWKTNDTIKLMKIDVEGAESWVLEGASNLLEKGLIQNIVYEENIEREKELGIKKNKSKEILMDNNYSVTALNPNQNGVCEYYATVIN